MHYNHVLPCNELVTRESSPLINYLESVSLVWLSTNKRLRANINSVYWNKRLQWQYVRYCASAYWQWVPTRAFCCCELHTRLQNRWGQEKFKTVTKKFYVLSFTCFVRSQNTHQSLPCTTLTGLFYNREAVCSLRGMNPIIKKVIHVNLTI